MNRIVVKIGSNVITTPEGLPDRALIRDVCGQMAWLIRQQGMKLSLVSSGAVAAGRSLVKLSSKTDLVTQRQVFAATGQPLLMQIYAEAFQQEGLQCAQVLVSKEDFRDRTHYLNMRNCLSGLLQQGIVPIINENDVVAITELMFTDNDELSGLLASMLDAEQLVILSNVDGVYDRAPDAPGAQVIRAITSEMHFEEFISTKRSEYGRGGMITKCKNALKVAGLGIHVRIANGRSPQVLPAVFGPNPPGTLFPATKQANSLKKWVAQAGSYSKGIAVINEGAVLALMSEKATSLLPIGVVKIQGDFEKGDLIEIRSRSGVLVAYGMATLNAGKAALAIGKHQQKPLVHYDHLYLVPFG